MKRDLKPMLWILLCALATTAALAGVSSQVPAGTSLQVRLMEELSSETANEGQVFHGTLAAPVVSKGKTLFPKGAKVSGEVVNITRSGRLSTPGELHLALRTIQTGGRTYSVTVRTIVVKGESHTKSNITKIGGGTAAGALIGAIAGGGKGAAIGAGVGAAAGTGIAAGTGKKPAQVHSEAVLTWVTDAPLSAVSQAPPARIQQHSQQQASPQYPQEDQDDQYDGSYGTSPGGFSNHDRQVINSCVVNDRSGLPPGLAKKDRLPPGLEKQLQRNGTLPPGLQKKVQPLPGSCVSRLPRLPADWARVVLSGRVILLDPRQRIVDMFWLD